MKLRNIFKLQKLYYLFFVRQVLSVGILKEKLFRVVLLLMGLVLFGYFLWSHYDGFDGMLVRPDVDWENTLIRGRITTDMMWTMLAFILIKLLFLKKGSFLKMTAQLPVTNRERSLSLLVFEMVLVFVIVAMMSAAYGLAFIWRFNAGDVWLLLSANFFTITTLYLTLQLGYVLLSYLLGRVSFSKLKVIFTYLALLSAVIWIQLEIGRFAMRFIDRGGYPYEGFHWSILFVWLHDEVHELTPIIVFLTFVSLSVFLILKIPNQVYVEEQSYMNIRIPFMKRPTLVHLYLLQLVRRVENTVTLLASTGLFIFFMVDPIMRQEMNPFNTFVLLGTLGVYVYIQTDCIRLLLYRFNYNGWQDYGALIVSQVLYLLLVTIPLLVVHWLVRREGTLLLYINGFSSPLMTMLMATCGGILFPAKKENPFSSFMGMMLTGIVMLFLIYVNGFLNLSPLATILVRGVFVILVILISVMGLIKLKEVVQHETH